MLIDDTTYKLQESNYIPIECIKQQIVFGNTLNKDMKHVAGWLHRYDGIYKKTAAYTIDKDGKIFKHFDPKFYTRYFNNLDLDKKTIVILLENEGWLLKDEQNNEFITWIGDIYKQPNQVFERRWRGYDHWIPYTEKQLDSASNLAKMLCEEFDIPKIAIGHNTKVDNLTDFSGILYKSNIDRHFNDLSPAWDFEEFKNKVELN